MRKLNLIILCLSITFFAFGQTLPTSKTADHLLIEGTNIYMVPPPSFLPSPNFKGFQNPNDPTAMIMTMAIPGPYAEVTAGFDPEMMKAQGMDLKSRKEINLGGYDGLLLEVNQAANGLNFSKYILAYGDESSTTIINGVFLEDSITLGKLVKESVLTTFLQTDMDVDPRAALPYTIDETIGALKFHSVIGNAMIFNRDLKTPTESKDRVTLLTDKSFVQTEIGDQKTFAISRIKSLPDDLVLIEEKGVKPIEIDQLKGYALFAKNNTNPEEEMYQVILFDDEGYYYLLLGTYLKGEQTAIDEIMKAIQTFKRR